MARRKAREFALKALYQADVSEGVGKDALGGLWAGLLDGEQDEKPAEADEIEFAERLVGAVDENKEEIDKLIDGASKNWRLVRMPTVDRNILRLAAGEMLLMSDVPVSVSINEAVELAKRFGDKESRAFVNGILDRIASIIGRGGRHHSQS
ncbi:MAG: transcription antitermination factor NusB [Deltaproteobacteria bacterium]|jgi:N utilization substance protein B|nr:transcription antitermination factor NusB [Deltaproteobacteria bacterium]